VKKEEKKIVKEAVKELFVKNYVRAKGISTTLKILLKPKDYEIVKNIVSNSIIKKTTKKEKSILENKLIGLRPDVKKNIIDAITNSEKLFLEILYNEMLKHDPQEYEKLTGILNKLK
jgi:hypothetical protein